MMRERKKRSSETANLSVFYESENFWQLFSLLNSWQGRSNDLLLLLLLLPSTSSSHRFDMMIVDRARPKNVRSTAKKTQLTLGRYEFLRASKGNKKNRSNESSTYLTFSLDFSHRKKYFTDHVWEIPLKADHLDSRTKIFLTWARWNNEKTMKEGKELACSVISFHFMASRKCQQNVVIT